MEKFKIGEFADRFDVSTQTLRYYHKIGLFKPKYIDKYNGYRYYTKEQIQEFRTIIYLRDIGVSLDKIRSYQKEQDIDILLKLLQDQKIYIDMELDKLKETRSILNEKILEIEKSEGNLNDYKVSIEEVPERYYYEIKIDFKMIQLYEAIEMIRNNIYLLTNENIYLDSHRCLLKINKDLLNENKFDKYNSIGMFQDRKKDKIVKSIKSQKFVIVNHKGSYNNISDAYKYAIDYIKENKYKITGDSIEYALIDTRLTKNPEQFYTEIQIPIK